ncbi:MAG: FIST N-terminal domain-containing protein [Candidatus Omnitrophota bacterium]
MAAAEAISQAKANLKHKEISLAIVFTSVEFASSNLLKTIGNLIQANLPLIGATSNAILTKEGIFNYGVAIALISAQEVHFKVASVKNALTNLQLSGDNLAKQLLFGMKDTSRRLGIFFSDAHITNNLPFLKGLQQRLGHSFPIIGATSASDNIHANKTFQYFNGEILNNSVVGLLWSGKTNFGLGVKHGWKPIGKPRRVNLSDNSVIKEIEDKPAVSLYQNYFAKDTPALKQELSRISYLYPIGMNISGEEEYLLRNIISIKDDGSLICRDDVPSNSQVRLMIGTKESCLAATEEAAKEAKQTLAQRAFPREEQASIVFVFNSLSRLYLLGRQISKELSIIKSYFPNTPIIGLCTYGEQAPLKATDFAGKPYCHNQTIVILAMN